MDPLQDEYYMIDNQLDSRQPIIPFWFWWLFPPPWQAGRPWQPGPPGPGPRPPWQPGPPGPRQPWQPGPPGPGPRPPGPPPRPPRW